MNSDRVRRVLLLSLGLAVAALLGLPGAAGAPQDANVTEPPAAAVAPPDANVAETPADVTVPADPGASETPADVTAPISSYGKGDTCSCSCACSPLAGAWIARLWTEQDNEVEPVLEQADTIGKKPNANGTTLKQTLKTFKFAPVNEKCDRFVVNAQATTRPQRVIKAFPEINDLTEFVGIACQSDSRQVDFTAIGYGLQRTAEEDKTVLIAVLSGTVELAKEWGKDGDGSHKCKCCREACKESSCSCKTGDFATPGKHGHPGKCCCCAEGCKYSDCECKSGKFPDRKDLNVDAVALDEVASKDEDRDKDKGKDNECQEPEELSAELTVAYFDAEQDADGDGFPDSGEKPVICLAYQAKFQRVKLLPQCKPSTPDLVTAASGAQR